MKFEIDIPDEELKKAVKETVIKAIHDTCTSEGACGDQANKRKWTDCEEKTERTHLMNWGYEVD